MTQHISQHIKCKPSGHSSTTSYLQHKIHVCVCLHSPRCSIRCFFTYNFTVTWCGTEFHLVMAQCSTVRLPWTVLDLGTVKRPLVACLVGYAWVSKLCASSSNRQLGAFNMSIPLINTSSDEVNLSSTLSQERLTCILLILALCVHPRASRAALFVASLKASGMSLVKIRGLDSCPGEFLILPGLCWRGFH